MILGHRPLVGGNPTETPTLPERWFPTGKTIEQKQIKYALIRLV
jgi:hypothetical protein